MIKKFIVRNYLNEILELELTNPEESGFIVKEVTGLGPDKSTLNIKEIANNDGGYFNSARTPVKNIVMNLLFIGTPMIEDTRHKSYRFFSTKKPLTLTVVTDRNELSINGYVESNEPDIFSEEEGCQISILCPFPYFSSDKKQIVQTLGSEGLFEFPFNNELIPDPYIEVTEEIKIPGSTTFMYKLSDDNVNLYYRYISTNKYDRKGYFPWRVSTDQVYKFISEKLSFNWLKNDFFGNLDSISDETYFIMYFSLDMHMKYMGYGSMDIIGTKTMSLKLPTYLSKKYNEILEIELLDINGNKIDPSNYSLTISGSNTSKDIKNIELSIKLTKDIINDIKELYFNVSGGNYDGNEFNMYNWNAYAQIYNVNFYRIIPDSIEPGITETKPRVEDCLIDETLPDYQFEQDDRIYNIQVSEGIIFGETNRYQFNHIISYNGTKDVGIIMTIEFENSLTINSYEDAGYLVITNTRYPGESIIIDFKKVTDLIKEALGQSDPDMEGDGGITGPPPLPPEETYSRPSAQKGDILTIDTRTGHKNVYYQRPGDWKYGNRRFSVLGAVNQDATWFSIYQGDNIFGIRHTFHPYLDDLQESDKDLVHADLLMVQTENDVLYEGV